MKNILLLIILLTSFCNVSLADNAGAVINTDSLSQDSLPVAARRAASADDPYGVQMPKFPYRSPEAAAFLRYGQYQTDEYTGVPDISIPLYELKDGDIDIPIAVTYDASGIKVAQEATWVGLGWNLNAGGCITLIPSGQVDYNNGNGSWEDYSKLFNSKINIHGDSTCFDFTNGYIPDGYTYSYTNYYTEVLEDLKGGLGERDIFSASVMGKHFMFFYNPFTSSFEPIGKVPERFTIRAENIKNGTVHGRSHDININELTAFTIKDLEGFTYYFSNKEITHEPGKDYPSAWNLTELTSPKGNKAYFEYTDFLRIPLIGHLSEQYMFITHPNNASEEGLEYGTSSLQTGYLRDYIAGAFSIDKSYLKRISTNNITVDFKCSRDKRQDMPGAARLDSFTAKDNITGRQLASWDFAYSYFIGSNIGGDYTQTGTIGMAQSENLYSVSDSKRLRLRLDEIRNTLAPDNVQTTSFAYNGTYLPLKTSFATDFWGYYNGSENRNKNEHITGYRTSIPDGPMMYMCGNITQRNDNVSGFKGANRFADGRLMQAATLSSINYPTGGRTTFNYEPNTFGLVSGQIFPESHEIEKTGLSGSIYAYTVTDSADNPGGAFVIDRNSTEPHFPPCVILVRLDYTGHYRFNISFSGDTKHDLWSLQDNGASVSIHSHVDGTSYTYTPDNAVGMNESLDKASSVSKDIILFLRKGWYTMTAALPDSCGENSSCSASASLTAAFSRDDIVDKDNQGLTWDCSTGGGLRIASISSYASANDSVPASKTTFDYKGGRLLIPECFGEFWQKATFLHGGFTREDRDDLYGGYTLSNSSLAFVGGFSSGITPGLVGYDRVARKEYDGNGRLLKTTVSTFGNKPAERVLVGLYQFKDYGNGELLTQTVINGNDTLQATVNTYMHEKKPFTCNIHLVDRSINDHCLMQHRTSDGFARYYSVVYSYYRIWNRLAKSVTTSYENNGKVSVTHEYAYNERNYKVCTDKYDSSENGKSFATTYKYPCDFDDDDVFKNMTADNVVSPVVEQALSCNGSELRRIRTTYGFTNVRNDGRLYFPSEVYTALNGGTLSKRLVYSDYDSRLNPRSFVKDGTEKAAWLWSYDHSYPVAEIHGMTYAEVAGVVGSSVLEVLSQKTPNASDLLSVSDKLQSSGRQVVMTCYLYQPGVGISWTMAPNGCKATFQYDGQNRLSAAYDNDGKLTADYKYKYGNGDNHIQTGNILDADASLRINSLQYFDGLGRPIQTSSNGIGGNGLYVSTVQGYQGFERTGRQWLPVVDKATPHQVWNSDNDLASLSENTYKEESYTYSDNSYDALDRVTNTTTPGEAWHAAGKAVTKEYVTNGMNDVRLYTAPMDGQNHLVKSGYYEPCQLLGETTTDEDGHSLTVYTDKLGRKVLERRGSDDGNNDTYFVYNDLGQLRFVLSPEYQNDQHKAIYGYEYRYDNRGNVAKKILPQCEYIQYWYDTADRLIFMQDGRMRMKGLYRFYLYDNLSRVVVEGTCSSCNRGGAVAHTTFNASNEGFLGTGYTFDHNLNLENPKLEIVNYYDNYEFLNLSVFKDNVALKRSSCPTSATNASGLSTGSITSTNRDDLLLSALYYDIKGHVTESHRTLPGDALLVTKNSYTFTGNTDSTTQVLYKGDRSYKSLTHNSYNPHNNKLSAVALSLDGSPSQNIRSIIYDDLGRINSVNHSSHGNSNSLPFGENQGEVYTYNLHGWITDIIGKNFEEHLTYNAGNQGTPYYNGNISTQQWKNGDETKLRGYKFTYDKLNRITNALYGEGSAFSTNANRYNERITGYTANGAITGIIRNGLKQDGHYGAIDSLNITLNGNQLASIEEKAAPVLRAGSFDFRKVTPPSEGQGEVEYLYDQNGALIKDSNRGITNIEYDLRNNPVCITFSDNSKTEYVYTATGEKLRTIHIKSLYNTTVSPLKPMPKVQSVAVNSGTGFSNPTIIPKDVLSKDSTDYIENFVFENGKPSKYLFAGGFYSYPVYAGNGHSFLGGTGEGLYFYLTDHLGNNRVVVDSNDSIVQSVHYYPFGAVYADAGKNPDFQKYKYTGKELDLTHGLNTYDHGARQNYSFLGVWDRVDPLAEKYYNISTYAVCANNPTCFYDLNGEVIDTTGLFGNDLLSYNTMIEGLRNSSKLFDKLYQTLQSSEKVIKVEYVDNLSNEGNDIDGCFYPDSWTINFNRNSSDMPSSVPTEEFFHAFQQININYYQNKDFNREFEAKVFDICVGLEGVGFGNINGMDEFKTRLEKFTYGNGDIPITPENSQSPAFIKDYNSSCIKWANYNIRNSYGNEYYRSLITSIPYSLQTILKYAYEKN